MRLVYSMICGNVLIDPVLFAAQLYMIAKKSRQESKGADSGSGVEILVGAHLFFLNNLQFNYKNKLN
jgi:hypothetical protein